RMPHDGRAPVVAEQNGRAISHMIDHGNDIRREMTQRIGRDFRWLRAAPIAAHVERGYPKTPCREMRDLVPPGVPELRKAMDADDQRAGAADRHIEFDRAVSDRDKF